MHAPSNHNLDGPSQPATGDPTHPPIVPGPLVNSQRSGWPSVIGVISIVFGVIGFIGGLWQSAGMMIFRYMGTRMASNTQGGTSTAPSGTAAPSPFPFDFGGMFAAMGKWAPYLAVAHLLLAAVAVLLVISGAGIVGRRAWGRTWAIRWAILRLLGGLLVAVLTGFMQVAQFHSMAQSATSGSSGAPPAAFFTVAGPLFAVFTGAITLLWYSAYPVFILIWMNQASVKSEIAAWR